MQYIELKEPGASVSLLVQKVERKDSKFGQDYQLIGNVEPNVQAAVSVPEKAFERQMEKMLHVTTADELKNRFVVVSRSEKPGPNGKLFWNVNWADESTYAHTPETPQLGAQESKRVQPPEKKTDTRTSGQKLFDEAVPEEPTPDPEPAPKPAAAPPSAQLPLEEAPAAPELSDAQKRNRAKMAELSRIYHALWEKEAEFQVLAAMRVQGKVAEALDRELDEVPFIVVSGESVGAGAATQFIQFNMRNLLG